jgi:hypothetical protein
MVQAICIAKSEQAEKVTSTEQVEVDTQLEKEIEQIVIPAMTSTSIEVSQPQTVPDSPEQGPIENTRFFKTLFSFYVLHIFLWSYD